MSDDHPMEPGKLWVRLHQRFAHRLGIVSEFDWSGAAVDSISVRAQKGRRNRTAPGRPGQAWLEDPRTRATARAYGWRSRLGSQRPDAHLFIPLLIVPIRGRRGRPRNRPARLHTDRAGDIRGPRPEVRRRGVAARIARKGVESSQGLGRHRWTVESYLA